MTATIMPGKWFASPAPTSVAQVVVVVRWWICRFSLSKISGLEHGRRIRRSTRLPHAVCRANATRPTRGSVVYLIMGIALILAEGGNISLFLDKSSWHICGSTAQLRSCFDWNTDTSITIQAPSTVTRHAFRDMSAIDRFIAELQRR